MSRLKRSTYLRQKTNKKKTNPIRNSTLRYSTFWMNHAITRNSHSSCRNSRLVSGFRVSDKEETLLVLSSPGQRRAAVGICFYCQIKRTCVFAPLVCFNSKRNKSCSVYFELTLDPVSCSALSVLCLWPET